MGYPFRSAVLAVIAGSLLGAGTGLGRASAGDEPKEEKAGGPATDGKENKEGLKAAADLTEREKKILDLFKASTKGFKDGKLYLKYDFERQVEDLVQDWLPALDQTRNRIRWARGLEGTMTTVEHGIIVSDKGEWVHKANFLPDIEVTVDCLSLTAFTPGNILGPTYYNEKKKKSIGANGGFQAMYLSGWTPAKPMVPKKEKEVVANVRQTMGYRFNGKVLECYANGRKTNDTSSAPKFAEKFEGGHVGFAWCGSIQCYIFSVTVVGSLDPDWTAKQLGESTGKGGKGPASGGTKAKK